MTDNDPEVGEILATYEIAEDEGEVTEQIVEQPTKPGPSKKSGKGKQKQTSKSNKALREINGGRVMKKGRK